MNEQPELDLPASTCAYERYNPDTLEPVNQETYLRLQELGWSSADFEGRTVLDIGCNSGLLTMYALRLGARQVHACDVQLPLVEFVTRVVKAKSLPVAVERLAFDKLQPATHGADVVLFMEVLHWVVSQGLELRTVIGRLAELTNDLLYIEFPWSIKEPSIQKQTKLTEEMYSADAVLDELTRYFGTVRVVRFMHYFGFGSQSKRVLIEARGKRPEAAVLRSLPRAYSLDLSLSRGRNESYLLATNEGPVVAKLLAPESSFIRLPEDLRNRMFDEIHIGEPKTIVAPKKFDGTYLLPATTGRYWMLFPFVGHLPAVRKPKPFPIAFDRLIELFICVRRDLRRFPLKLRQDLVEYGLYLNTKSVLAGPKGEWSEFEELANQVEQAVKAFDGWNPGKFDALCHGDLQTGNFVFDEEGKVRVIDLDNLCVGTIYSDGLTGLIWRGATSDTLSTFCNALATEESRGVMKHDVHLAIANGFAWLASVYRSQPNRVPGEQISRCRNGLAQAVELASACEMDPRLI